MGGPAKVAVLASGFFGTISGSSVANTVSTGTFTIPLMKSVGYRGAFAGAVEAASSSGRPDHAPDHGRGGLHHGPVSGRGLCGNRQGRADPGPVDDIWRGLWSGREAKRLGLKGIPKERLPRAWFVLRQGGYLLIPIFVLIYLLIQAYTPLKSAYYCILATAPFLWPITGRPGPEPAPAA